MVYKYIQNADRNIMSDVWWKIWTVCR